MTEIKTCPSCGATLDSNVGSQCPFCNSALPAASSAQTLISVRPLSKKAEFDNSAEAMDEIKRLVREGEEDAATKIASQQFDLKPEDAKNTVEQVAEEMKYSGGETMLAGHTIPPPPPPVTSQASYSTPASPAPASYSRPTSGNTFDVEPPKPSKKNWIIGGSIGAVIFLCLCCCLPLLYLAFNFIKSSNP